MVVKSDDSMLLGLWRFLSPLILPALMGFIVISLVLIIAAAGKSDETDNAVMVRPAVADVPRTGPGAGRLLADDVVVIDLGPETETDPSHALYVLHGGTVAAVSGEDWYDLVPTDADNLMRGL